MHDPVSNMNRYQSRSNNLKESLKRPQKGQSLFLKLLLGRLVFGSSPGQLLGPLT